MHRRSTPAVAGIALVVLAIVAACSAPTAAHWSDDGIHLVDGYWILEEHPCEVTADGCLDEVRAAELSMDIPAESVAGAATAVIPSHWTRADGQTIVILATTQRNFVVSTWWTGRAGSSCMDAAVSPL